MLSGMAKGGFRGDAAPVYMCPVCGCEMQLVRGREKPNGSRSQRFEWVLHCFGDPETCDFFPVHSPMGLADYNLMMRLRIYGPDHPSTWSRNFQNPVLAELVGHGA